jgi:hypothetical protein
VFLSHELSIMDFLFSRCQSSATDDQLKEATALASTGTIGDVDKLLSWLNASAASPSGTTLCAACCEAIEQIAQRGDWEGEAGRAARAWVWPRSTLRHAERPLLFAGDGSGNLRASPLCYPAT